MATQFTSFTRPASPLGTGQPDPLVNALLKQALSRSAPQRPSKGIDDLNRAALTAFLRRTAADKPSEPVPPEQADSMGGVELDPNGGFRTIGVAGDPKAARVLDLFPLIRRV